MKYRWDLKPSPNEELVKQLSNELNIRETLAGLLVARGISSFQEAREYFRPSLDNLHDPFLLKDMDLAVERINNAIAKNERILIYGDYDVDGTTSVSLVYLYLNKYFKNLQYYVPDRHVEGYGISTQGIDFAAETGVSVIIALDCGIKAIDKINYAKEKGIDFIICDHHRPGDCLPDAVAVIDQKRDDCTYPYKHLSGCGIGFKLMQALSIQNNWDKQHLFSLLDLVAISIACDIVPITGENRILCHYGLKIINENPRGALQHIIQTTKLKPPISVSDLVFYVGPRINAAGRLDHAKRAVDLLISENAFLAKEKSESIEELNTERRTIDKDIKDEALAMVKTPEYKKFEYSTVLFNENWHKGVIGIVASRVVEERYRPTIMLTLSNGKATGSARSIKGFDVYNAIESCSDLIDQFGGHMYAAGLTMNVENIQPFRERFETFVRKNIEEHMLTPSLDVDMEISLADVTEKVMNIVDQMEPFGPDNMKPLFVARNLQDVGQTKPVGKEKEHLKFDVAQQCGESWSFASGIGFGMGKYYNDIKNGATFDLVFEMQWNVFQGNRTVQLFVKDIKINTPS